MATTRRGGRGRRPGKQDTRGAILASARDVFATHGYDRASVRQIAAAAGVDAALVHHYFGTKERLFQEVLAVPIAPEELLPQVFSGGPDGIPEALVRAFLSVWEHPVTGPAMVGFLRTAASHGSESRLFRDYFAARILRSVGAQLEGQVPADELPFRVSLVASQMIGLALTRYVLKFDGLAPVEPDRIVHALTPTVARYLFGELDETVTDPFTPEDASA